MSTPGNREVAHRLFAAEFDDADLEYSESDEERAPNYVVTPSGARVNRLFFVGVLTETERVNDDVLRARVVDPTGAFVVYAGQYQPDELAFLEGAEPPTFVAVTGKARTFQPDDSDRTFTSVRPETITEVGAGDRDRAAVTAAEHTVDRVAAMADALGREERGDDLQAALVADGTPPELAEGIALAIDHYGTDLAYLDALRTLAVDVARVVAGDRDEAGDLPLAPDAEPSEPVDRAALTAAPETLTAGDTEAAVATGGESASGDDAAADDETTATADDETAEATAAANGETVTPDDGDEASASADDEPTTTTGSEVDAKTTTGETVEPDPGATDDAGGPGPDDGGASADTAMGSEGIDDDGDAGDDLGDFDGSLSTDADDAEAPADADSDASGAADAAAADETEPTADTDEMYEFDEEERQEIEEEYGTEFSTGSEVESPDEDLAPDPDEAAESDDADAATEGGADDEEDEAAAADAAANEVVAEEAADGEADADADEAGDADVDDVLLDAMQELDDGDGAERAALIDAVVERTGADEGAVEDAIQDALMGGRCYEPDDDRLKPI